MNTRATIRKELLVGFISVLSAALLAGCASSSLPAEAAARTPYGKLLQDAATYIGDLKDEDKLPGFRKGDHGSISSIPEPLSEKEVAFPISVVLRATNTSDGSFYRYTVMKLNTEATWQMVEATRWDKNGQIEQLLLK